MFFKFSGIIQLTRLMILILSSLSLYAWNYTKFLAGQLAPLVDSTLIFASVRELLINLTGCAIGAFFLVGIFGSLKLQILKRTTLLIISLKDRESGFYFFRLWLKNRKFFMALLVSITTLALLYLNFTGSIYYFIQFIVGFFMCGGISIVVGSKFYGGKNLTLHRFVATSEGGAFFLILTTLFLLAFVSINLASGRVDLIRQVKPVEITVEGRKREIVLLGTTGQGLLVFSGLNSSKVEFIPFSQISGLQEK